MSKLMGAANLAPMTDNHEIQHMLLFTDRGQRSIDDRDVIAVYRDEALGGYCSAVLVLASGEEISGRCLVAAVNRIERDLADQLLPPEAA
jgi:hypothetical protein